MLYHNLKFPLALILTHRRGVGIAIITNEKKLYEVLNEPPNYFFNAITQKIQKNSNFEFLGQNDMIFTRVLGKTAENLYNLYQFSLQLAGFSTTELSTCAVGIGPGSFTGLRLGCAFSNGIKLGNPEVNLIPVTTYLTTDLLEKCEQIFSTDSCKEQLGEFAVDDESTGFITFYDLYFCLIKLIQENKLAVDSLIPEYGRQPGPVIKMLQGNNI